MNEPIADAVRGLLDGHIVLSRKLAWKNHFPAISVLESLSRLMPAIADKNQLNAAARIRDLISAYQEAEDLINIGAYKKGSNPKIDLAIEKEETINTFLKQQIGENTSYEDAVGDLISLLDV
jgi:flagellum-specific ATP synthase